MVFQQVHHQWWNLLLIEFQLISTKRKITFFCYIQFSCMCLKAITYMYQGICCSNSFLRVTCFYKTFWCRNTMASVYNVTLCAIFLQTLSSTTHFYASIHFMFTNLCTTCIPASCVLCIHTKGSAPTTFPLVCANLNKLDFFCALSFFKNPENSQAKQGYKERQENCSWIEKSIQ